MITEHQKEYIEKLYEDLGQEVEVDLDELTKAESHKLIKELLEMKLEL